MREDEIKELQQRIAKLEAAEAKRVRDSKEKYRRAEEYEKYMDRVTAECTDPNL